MENFKIIYAKALYLRFCAIYGDKFLKSYHDADFKELWAEEWSTGLAGIDPSLIKDCLEYCKKNLEFPPSIAKFRQICEEASGIPSCETAFQSAIKREFTHPIISLSYEIVGSWAIKHDKHEVLYPKFKTAYIEALNEFRENPHETWKKLDKFKEKLAIPKLPPKIPSRSECKKFSERMAEYKKMAEEAKASCKIEHPTWSKTAMNRHHVDFDQKLFDERRDYLVKISEVDANSLNNDDKYDRIRFLRETEAHDAVEILNYTSGIGSEEKTSSRAYNKGKVIYGSWNN